MLLTLFFPLFFAGELLLRISPNRAAGFPISLSLVSYVVKLSFLTPIQSINVAGLRKASLFRR